MSNWGEAESTITSHGDETVVIEKLVEETMHNTADRRSVLGRFKLQFQAPNGSNGEKSINVVVMRNLHSTPTTKSCQNCDCDVGNAQARVDMPNDDEISEAPADFPRDLPAQVELREPPPASITLATTNTRRYSLAEKRQTRNIRAVNIFKRAYGTCSVTYDNNNYPSTAKSTQLPPDNSKADGMPQITKWIDWSIFQGSVPTFRICDWRVVQYPNRQPNREYATEHVFEKHLIASFLKWAQKPFGLCVRADCTKINNVFNRVSQTAGSPFVGNRPANVLSNQLSDNTRLNEFFILEAEVNTAKTVILSHNLEFSGLPALYESDPWARTLQTIRVYSMAFNYMNAPAVSNIFHNTNQRMRTVLDQIDNDPFYNNNRPSTCDDGHGQQTPNTWRGLWDEWIAKFITYKEIKMTDWITSTAVPLLRRQITRDVADPVIRQELLDDVSYFSQQGNWLSGGAFSFADAYHNLS
jgi:hypothetical protein